MEKFFKKWHGKGIRDDGAVTSREFASFANGLKKVLETEAEKRGMRLETFSKGHYYVSGFFTNEQDCFVYFSFDVPRGQLSMDLTSKSCCEGFLVRTAKHGRDFTGGQNTFTNFPGLMDQVQMLMRMQEVKKAAKSVA